MDFRTGKAPNGEHWTAWRVGLRGTAESRGPFIHSKGDEYTQPAGRSKALRAFSPLWALGLTSQVLLHGDPTLRSCSEWNQNEQGRNNRDLGKKGSPKGNRTRKFQKSSCHVFEHDMNVPTPRSKSSGKLISRGSEQQKSSKVKSHPRFL